MFVATTFVKVNSPFLLYVYHYATFYFSRFEDMPYFITPHELLNLRNYIKDNKAYFVILARNNMDVAKAVQFSAQHNLAFSVFGTGHEFQDRNSGQGLNGLLIRTICLRTVDIDLDPINHFKHPDGVCIV